MHGRLILPALRWRDDTGFDHEAGTIAAALGFGAGGFILFGGLPEAVRKLTAELRDRADRPLLIAADLERGAGQQFPGLTEFPPPGALAALHDPAAVAAAAQVTAREALELGVNWVLAPDADLDIEPRNPIVQTRSFGGDPATVGAAVSAWVTACQGQGALACVKHFPGHGRTTRDSHDEVPAVGVDLATLERTDLAPFRAGIAAGVATVMTGHLRVPALDPTGAPATFSATMLRYLRESLGFSGLIVTDALMMGAAVADAATHPAARALAAGCDLLCYPADPRAAHEAIGEAVRSGALPEARISDALTRYGEALLRAGAPAPAARHQPRESGDPGAAKPERADQIADRLLAQGMVRGPAPVLRAPLDLVVVDDDLGGAWPASPSDFTARALRDAGVRLGAGGSRVVLAFAEPRASKGRAGFGAASLEAVGRAADADLVVVFGHPRLAAEVPPGAPVLLAWHRQRLMQEAVARWLRGRLA
jgi:beta-glucosidase-like glycosyl hydrolase